MLRSRRNRTQPEQPDHESPMLIRSGDADSYTRLDKQRFTASTRHVPTPTAPSSTSMTSSSWIHLSFLLILLLGSSTLVHYYRRERSRADSQISAMNSHISESDDSTEQHVDIHSLQSRTNELRVQLAQYENRHIPGLETEVQSIRSRTEVTLRRNEMFRSEIEGMQSELSKVNTHVVELKQEFVKRKSGKQSPEEIDDVDLYVERKETELWNKIDRLVENIKIRSREEVVEWFGPGPHRVELELEFPRLTPTPHRVRGVLLIELAPLHLMPVATNLFLQQIHHKLWNGCAFAINAVHILQAGAHRFLRTDTYDPNSKELRERFVDSKLDIMPFQEYHSKFPHVQWTLGFAGRPAGPDFYINKIDNSVNHGPGGQGHHDLHEEADPCFGRVVGGMEILEEIGRLPVSREAGFLLSEHVEIVEGRVVSEERNPLKEHEHDYEREHDQEHAHVDNEIMSEKHHVEHGNEGSSGTEGGERAGPGPSSLER